MKQNSHAETIQHVLDFLILLSCFVCLSWCSRFWSDLPSEGCSPGSRAAHSSRGLPCRRSGPPSPAGVRGEVQKRLRLQLLDAEPGLRQEKQQEKQRLGIRGPRLSARSSPSHHQRAGDCWRRGEPSHTHDLGDPAQGRKRSRGRAWLLGSGLFS